MQEVWQLGFVTKNLVSLRTLNDIDIFSMNISTINHNLYRDQFIDSPGTPEANPSKGINIFRFQQMSKGLGIPESILIQIKSETTNIC